MDLDQILKSINTRSYQKTCHIQANPQDKENTHRKKCSIKQIEEVQFHFLIFSALQFKKNQLFLKLRLLKKMRKIAIFRKRKNQLRTIQRLKAINEALETLKKRRDKQAEQNFSTPTTKPITLIKDLTIIGKEIRSTPLKRQSKFYH